MDNGIIEIDKSFDKKNANNQIIKFYRNNTNCTIDRIDGLSILTYNVHWWRNINAAIDIEQNFKNIINFIKSVSCSIIILQEIDTHTIKLGTTIDALKSAGYTDFLYAPNGRPIDRQQTMFIMICSKGKLNNKKILDLTVWKYTRNCLTAEYNGISIAAVHLEVGKNLFDPNLDKSIIAQYKKDNEEMRIKQLKQLLNTDIIVGDFNFGLDAVESKWLRKEQQFGLVDDTVPTNPFNTRTDMVFIKLSTGIAATKSITVSCNYSDHLPVITIIKKP
jgi:endonuclease/exonuclease/phosphatase family metal-dependent hydrolase